MADITNDAWYQRMKAVNPDSSMPDFDEFHLRRRGPVVPITPSTYNPVPRRATEPPKLSPSLTIQAMQVDSLERLKRRAMPPVRENND